MHGDTQIQLSKDSNEYATYKELCAVANEMGQVQTKQGDVVVLHTLYDKEVLLRVHDLLNTYFLASRT